MLFRSGTVDGLFPGATRTLMVHVDNPSNSPLDLTGITTKAISSNQGCDPSVLAFDDSNVRKTIAPHSSVEVPVQVRMSTSAPDACIGVGFQLSYVGVGITAGTGAISQLANTTATAANTTSTTTSIGRHAAIESANSPDSLGRTDADVARKIAGRAILVLAGSLLMALVCRIRQQRLR